MDYKNEMRKLIDIIKQQSFDAPLEQTLEDMKTLSSAVKDLSDRIEMRVRKSTNPNDKGKNKVIKKKKTTSAFPKTKFPKLSTASPTQQDKALPTANTVSSKAVSANDINNIKNDFVARQNSVKPITPQSPM